VIRALALSIVLVLGVLLSVLTFASLLRSVYWLFDVFTHFHFNYGLGLVICLFGVVLLRPHPVFPVMFALALLVNASMLLPFFWPQSLQISGEPLRVMSLNVFADNKDYARILGYLRGAHADIVLLSEIEPALIATFQENLTDVYPYIYDESLEGTHGLAFISKYPFTATETVALDERHHRFLTAELQWQGQSVKLYGAHPHPPLSPFWTRSRDEEIRVIRNYVAQESKPHIFLGDFNASPWSQPLRQFVAETRLRHAALGFGMYPTWRYKTMLIAAPLDHIFVSSEWQVRSYTPGHDVGSDHFPVLTELHLPQ
jgi:endonuclease/exonuclease/phosphatase (EEP) superfamily protein YafD